MAFLSRIARSQLSGFFMVIQQTRQEARLCMLCWLGLWATAGRQRRMGKCTFLMRHEAGSRKLENCLLATMTVLSEYQL